MSTYSKFPEYTRAIYETHLSSHEMSDDELMHWKYIKREKVNGKWRYYYKDDKLDEANKSYEMAKDHANSVNAGPLSKRILTEATYKRLDTEKKYNNSLGKKVADLLNESSEAIDNAKKWLGELAGSGKKKTNDSSKITYLNQDELDEAVAKKRAKDEKESKRKKLITNNTTITSLTPEELEEYEKKKKKK